MKKILQINVVVNSGSTGRIAEQIGQLAIQNGWESYIAYGRNRRPSDSKLIKIGTDWDVKIHGIQTRLLDNHGLASKSSTLRLIKKIKEIKPDIIHLHNLHGYYVNIEILFNYLSKSNIPIVWTFHDCWPITGHCTYFDFIGCDKWKTSCHNCPQKREYPASYFIDRSKRNHILKKQLFSSVSSLTITSVSQWLANIIQQSFLGSFPVHLINNGVNIENFKPIPNSYLRDQYNLHDKMIIIGVASVWSSRKGLRDFIQLSKCLDINYQIILVGLTEKQKKILPKNIIALEKTENIQKLTLLYSEADVVLNLSYEETFGLTTVEGLACGTPGIVYNCTASPELITPETGIIVEKGNITGIVNAINKIKTKGKKFYSEHCIERAKVLYNKDNRYQDYLNLYDSIISKH